MQPSTWRPAPEYITDATAQFKDWCHERCYDWQDYAEINVLATIESFLRQNPPLHERGRCLNDVPIAGSSLQPVSRLILGRLGIMTKPALQKAAINSAEVNAIMREMDDKALNEMCHLSSTQIFDLVPADMPFCNRVASYLLWYSEPWTEHRVEEPKARPVYAPMIGLGEF
jgi:hypothetical protein